MQAVGLPVHENVIKRTKFLLTAIFYVRLFPDFFFVLVMGLQLHPFVFNCLEPIKLHKPETLSEMYNIRKGIDIVCNSTRRVVFVRFVDLQL